MVIKGPQLVLQVIIKCYRTATNPPPPVNRYEQQNSGKALCCVVLCYLTVVVVVAVRDVGGLTCDNLN